MPCPASGGNTAEDDPEMEEFRFFKWAKRQHSEYRAYSSGGESRLNYDRVKKLTEIGFEFK